MALDGTYDGLKASIVDWLMRGDLAAQAPDFISLAEAQINSRLRVRRMVARASAIVDSEFCKLPDDFAGPLTIVLPDGTDLDCLAADALLQAKRRSGLKAGNPRGYSVVGEQFQFWPAP